MLQTKMNVNSVSRNGAHAMPSGPIVCRMMSLRTKSTTASARFWAPAGTSCPLLADQKKPSTMITASHSSRTTLLMAKTPLVPKRLGQLMRWLIGGNSIAREPI